jgi:hypothetical protein
MVMTHQRVVRHNGPAQEWDGELAAHDSTRLGGKPRWAEISVWKLDGGGWLVHRQGRSLIYHREGTTCRTAIGRKPGAVAIVHDLPDDADPCDVCNPPYPEELGEDEKVRYEFPNHTFEEAGDVAGVLRALTTYRDRRTGKVTVRVSGPVASVLEQLGNRYEEFERLDWPGASERGPMEQGDDLDNVSAS